MLNLFKKFINFNQREVDRLKKRVDEINALEDKARVLKDADFIQETKKLRSQVQNDAQSLDESLPWAYALVREMARRTLGERHYDSQLMAGVALHEGKVAEQKTGEGKTLSATAPLYLNALAGNGAHLVTVNDYLARRDTGWMGQLYHNLGLSVAAIISDKSFVYDPEYIDEDVTDWRLIHLRPTTRKEAYGADITYGINSEFGFDYLRDNMAFAKADFVQRGFHYAIIDEVDSVLIDEARTPHIISAPFNEDTSKYYQYARIVEKLNSDDYVIDEKSRTAHLNEKGIGEIEKMIGVANIYEKDFDTLFYIEAALKARALFKKDKDYIVKDNEVVIVDEFTGRLLHGRRFSEGLHQAIEAKENVTIKRESKTLATVSLQNYFRMYEKLAGMTGTAATEAEEFAKIYKLEVVALPTNKKNIRTDHPDIIYKTERAKYNAVAEMVLQEHKTGRPVLIGTTSIEKNELLSELLRKKGIKHELLNAKNHEREAMIISNAGTRGAVTVATNMAGRGVDILLGGEPPNRYETRGSNDKATEEKAFEKRMNEWRQRHDEVLSLGGLFVIGTERHESRRIDNQLRGRSGRQGDPGETRFFISLEDDLMRIFGGEQVTRLMNFFKIPEDQPLEHTMVSRALEQAQVKVEGFNFDIRKHLVDYDDVLNKQREIVYRLRKKILVSAEDNEKKVFSEAVIETVNEEIAGLVNVFYLSETEPQYAKLAEEAVLIVPEDRIKLEKALQTKNQQEAEEYLNDLVEKLYKKKEKEMGPELWMQAIKSIYISTIDKYWTEHLTTIEDLREGINLRGYAQLDPLIEYKNEAFSMFEKLLSDINYEITRRIFKLEMIEGTEKHIHVHAVDESQMRYQSASQIDPYAQTAEIVSESVSSQTKGAQNNTQESSQEIAGFKLIPPGSHTAKPGRNDPCWCGSGKKYKKCHYPD